MKNDLLFLLLLHGFIILFYVCMASLQAEQLRLTATRGKRWTFVLLWRFCSLACVDPQVCCKLPNKAKLRRSHTNATKALTGGDSLISQDLHLRCESRKDVGHAASCFDISFQAITIFELAPSSTLDCRVLMTPSLGLSGYVTRGFRVI